MKAALTPDPSFFGVLEFNAASRAVRSSVLFVRQGVQRRIALPPRLGVKTRAADELGRPRVVNRLPPRRPDKRRDVAQALVSARQAQALLGLDQQADRLLGEMTENDRRLAALHTQAPHGDVTEAARRVLAGSAEDLRAWTLGAEQLERAMMPGSQGERRRRMGPPPATSLPVRAPVVQAAGGGSGTTKALALGGSRPYVSVSAGPPSGPQARLNRLAARPVATAGGAALRAIATMETALHESAQVAAMREQQRQRQHAPDAPVLKPRSQKETSH